MQILRQNLFLKLISTNPLRQLNLIAGRDSTRGITLKNSLFILAVFLISFYYRLPSLNPYSLWLDDLWVAVLVKSAPLSFIFTERYPLSPGFVLLLRGVVWLLGDGSWQLQLIPLVCSLALIVLIARTGHLITGIQGIGLFASILLAGSHTFAVYSLRVKQPTIDGLASLLILYYAILCVQFHRKSKFFWLLCVSGISAVISYPAILVGLVFLNLTSLYLVLKNEPRFQRCRAIVLSTISYNILVAIEWFFLLRKRLNQPLVNSFSEYYLPVDGFHGLVAFLASHGFIFLSKALPDLLSGFIIFAPLGLYYLMRRRETRFWSSGVLLLFFAIFVASALRIYPIGVGRSDVFIYPITVLLVSSAVWAVCQRLPLAWLICSAFVLAVLLQQIHRDRIEYPEFGDKEVVEKLQGMIQPEDALIVYPYFNWAVGYYSSWPHSLVSVDDSSIGFYVRVEREKTLVLRESLAGIYFYAKRSVVEEQLHPFLKSAPKRIFYVGTVGEDDPNLWIIQSIESHGYKLETKACNDHLKIFRRSGNSSEQ